MSSHCGSGNEMKVHCEPVTKHLSCNHMTGAAAMVATLRMGFKSPLFSTVVAVNEWMNVT